MSPTYLLPCSCGQKIIVDTSLAGDLVTCEACGQTVEVPTLLRLKQLEPAVPEQARPARRAWGAKQKVLVVGLLVTAIGVGLTTWCILTWPLPPVDMVPKDHIPETVAKMSPIETVSHWRILQRGVDAPFPDDIAYLKSRTRHQFFLAGCLLILVAGLVVDVVALALSNDPLEQLE